MWYVCDVLYAVLYVCVNCFVVWVCAVSMRYINVCNSDVFVLLICTLTNVVCINGRRYVCCSECYDFSNKCDEHLLSCVTYLCAR